MKRLALLFSWLCLLLSAAWLPADEGMWLYNAFPKAKVKAKYGFAPSPQWLDHVQLSSVRFNNGGSGSFVSPDGLAFTNHHVGADCIQKLSTSGGDHIKTGFYAPTRAEEAKCPDLELNVLIGIEDVTAKVNAGVNPGMPAAEASQAQRAAMSTIEQDCATSPGLRCDVVGFYSGEMFHLYRYKKYTDVRLVFAPEFDIAFFGGDPDNFTYPRYDLDITFFRVYENDKPVHSEHYLRWSQAGVKEGDLIFVSGHPGNTGRLRTMAQLEFLRDVDYPSRLETYQRRIALLKQFSAESEENARVAKEELFSYQNSFKAYTGFIEGLRDRQIMARRAAEEQKLRRQDGPGSGKTPETGDPWGEIARAMQVYKEIYPPLTYVERLRGFNSTLAEYARDLVRVAHEKARPNEQRLREYRESRLSSLEQELFSTAPLYKSFESVTLADSLAQMQEALGGENSTVRRVLNGKSPAEAAKDLVASTTLQDPAVRKQLYQGGVPAIEASNDPLIVLMRNLDSDARALRKRMDDEVDAVERRDGTLIAKARFAQSGLSMPPDATFTLRLSYGSVKGYTENGRKVPYCTTIGETFEHAARHDNQPPYQLPASWMKAKPKLALPTALNFVSTADIIGGNSGSPTINKAGEVVGIIFDGNIQSLPWNFAFDDKVGRAVSVDARGIQEALRKIYGAEALADELKGKPTGGPVKTMRDGKKAEKKTAVPKP
jgi:hypothetical protein